MAVDKSLLEILRCPEGRAPLVLEGDHLVSTDGATRRRYQVEDDIPNMIMEESEVMDKAPWLEIMQKHGIVPAGGEGEV